jgi:hypothetical protein
MFKVNLTFIEGASPFVDGKPQTKNLKIKKQGECPEKIVLEFLSNFIIF